ncbi:MAG: hypothetical protein R2843_08675 [Thermomicrobiales bacterium]
MNAPFCRAQPSFICTSAQTEQEIREIQASLALYPRLGRFEREEMLKDLANRLKAIRPYLQLLRVFRRSNSGS